MKMKTEAGREALTHIKAFMTKNVCAQYIDQVIVSLIGKSGEAVDAEIKRAAGVLYGAMQATDATGALAMAVAFESLVRDQLLA